MWYYIFKIKYECIFITIILYVFIYLFLDCSGEIETQNTNKH